jgi:hypothetical protein
MLESLIKLKQSVYFNWHTVDSYLLGRDYKNDEELNLRLLSLGHLTALLSEVKSVIHNLTNLKKGIINHLEGKPLYDFELDDTPEPTIYEYLNGYFINEMVGDFNPHFSNMLLEYINVYGQIEKKKAEGFKKFFPNVTLHSQNEYGEMIPMSDSEISNIEFSKQLSYIEVTADLESWHDYYNELREKIASEAPLSEILKMLN